MASFTGTVRHNDLEGGFFELHTGEGASYRLQGAKGLPDGAKVVVHGTLESGGFGLQMSGPAISVEKIDSA